MRFSVSIDYSQISVCDEKDSIFSQWNENHVAQGFVWRENHVSFGIPDHDGLCLVETCLVTDFLPIRDDVIRAIEVPLSAPYGIRIATITEDYPIEELASGDYGLQFRLIKSTSIEKSPEFGDDYAYLLQFLFRRGKSQYFKILRSSGEMTTDKVLTKEANLG